MRFDIGETWMWFKNVLFWISNCYQVLVEITTYTSVLGTSIHVYFYTPVVWYIMGEKKTRTCLHFCISSKHISNVCIITSLNFKQISSLSEQTYSAEAPDRRGWELIYIIVLEQLKCMFLEDEWWNGERKGQFCTRIKWNFCSLTVETHLYNLYRVCMSRK